MLLEKIKSKTKGFFNNAVIKSMMTVGIITFFIKALAFYKETVIAGSFGLSELLDTFLVALLVPTFIQSVFLDSVKNIFIPNYIIELKNNGNIASFQSVVGLMILLISLISYVLSLVFIDLFLDVLFPNHTIAYYNLVKNQLYIILPCLFLWGFTSVFIGLLEIRGKFFLATISQVFPLITMLFFLFMLKDNLGQMVLAYGTLAGTIIAFLYLLVCVLKNKVLTLGKVSINSNLKMMFDQLPPKITSSFLSIMNTFIDQFFAGQLIVGSIAALNYGNRVPAFGVTIVIVALGSVLLPHFSRLATEDLKSSFIYLFKILKSVFIICSIAVIVLILFSENIVEFWLERNQFTSDDTYKVSLIQKILLANVPFYLCTLITVKFLTSINKNKFMAKVSFLNLFLNIILNIILIEKFGVFGLALGTTIVLIISSFFYVGFTFLEFKKIRI